MNTPDTITPEALQARLEAGETAIIIDVREPEEYRSVHAAGALPLPLGEVTAESVAARLAGTEYRPGTAVYFICHTGRRATEACTKILADYPTATVVEGGTLAWAQAGLPVHSGEHAS